jgi:hypothetical protein
VQSSGEDGAVVVSSAALRLFHVCFSLMQITGLETGRTHDSDEGNESFKTAAF